MAYKSFEMVNTLILNSKILNESLTLLFFKNKIALKQAPFSGAPLSLPSGRDFLETGLGGRLADLQWVNEVGLPNGETYFCGELCTELELPPSWCWLGLR